MRVRRTVNLLVMMMMMMMMMDTHCSLSAHRDVWTLPAPSSVSMESVDMRHILKWRPLQAPCDTAVLYSVQFQGEFELEVLNGSWVDAPECQQTPHAHCDLTSDLGSDSDYNLQVRAQCGSQRSPWTKLSPPFNRRDAVPTVPDMAVTAVGGGLRVSFSRLPVSAVLLVTVWKRGDKLQPAVHTVLAEQPVLLVADLQEGQVYCVRAQTSRDSSTDTQCVPITAPGAAWRKPASVAVTVVIMAGLLFAISCAILRCPPEACQLYFQKEPLPSSLRPDWDIRLPMSPEEAELCELRRGSVSEGGAL